MGGAPRLAAGAAGLFAALLVAGRADARTGGINGASGKQGSTCAECHNGGTRPNVAFEPLDAVHPGDTVAMRFTVHATSPAAKAGGFNVAVEGGTLVALPGRGAHLSNGEITHNEPLANDAEHNAGWDFQWIAPAAPGRYRIWGAGNSVNLNGQSTGDKSNAVVLRVDVVAAVASETPTVTAPPATVTATAPFTATPSPAATASASPTATAPAPTATATTTASEPATATPSPVDTDTPSATATAATATPSPTVAAETPTASPTATESPLACAGDCSGDGTVAINELVIAVAIALDSQPLATCPSADGNGDQRIAINELVELVNNALTGC